MNLIPYQLIKTIKRQIWHKLTPKTLKLGEYPRKKMKLSAKSHLTTIYDNRVTVITFCRNLDRLRWKSKCLNPKSFLMRPSRNFKTQIMMRNFESMKRCSECRESRCSESSGSNKRSWWIRNRMKYPSKLLYTTTPYTRGTKIAPRLSSMASQTIYSKR